MKRKNFILLVALFLVMAGIAQDEATGIDFDNRFYIRAGYSNPSWLQFGATSGDWGKGATRKGYCGEIGTIFMFKSIEMPKGTSLGIDVTYISGFYHQFSFVEDSLDYDVITYRADSKIGPSFTYSPANGLSFDVFAKADISWFAATNIIEDGDSDESEYFTKTMAIGFSTGVNIRYSILMIGFEYNIINPSLENWDIPGEYIGNLNDESSTKSPLPSVSFTLGVNF